MKYQFEFLPAARRQLMAIEQPVALDILTRLARLGDDPYREDADVKKLAGTDGIYRLRVGNYRVAYQIDNGRLMILVVKVAHRREVYRDLSFPERVPGGLARTPVGRRPLKGDG